MSHPWPQWVVDEPIVRSVLEGATRILDASELGTDVGPRHPAPGSPADRQIQLQSKWDGNWGDQLVTRAMAHACHALLSGEQHLLAITRLHQHSDLRLVYPMMSLLRPCLEASGRSRWLGDASIGAKERIARLKTEGLLSNHELTFAVGGDPEQAAPMRESRRRILDTARAFQFDVGEPKKAAPWVGKPHPGSAPLCGVSLRCDEMPELEERGVQVFRAASATSHGLPWGIASYLVPDEDNPTVARPTISPGAMAASVAMGAVAVVNAMHEFRVLRGYADEPSWTEVRATLPVFLNLLRQTPAKITVTRLPVPADRVTEG